MAKLYKFIFILLLFLYYNLLYCQNEFYNNGAVVYLSSGASSTTPTLFVNGNLINQDGEFTNDGSFLELKGNITNNPTSYHYISTGIERFTGNSNQTIYGSWNGTTSNQDQFYTLKINKSSSTGENIILDNSVTGNTVKINAGGSLVFESSNGIIRTQSTSSTSPYTGDYTNTLYVQNPSTSAISGHSSGNGATTKYIEGKLRRQVSSGTYFFPVGVEKTGFDGMEAFTVTINSLTMPSGSSTGLLGYIQPATNLTYMSDLVADGDKIFFDVGAFTGNQIHFSECTGGPDGQDDVAVIDQAITHEWIVTPNTSPTAVDYDITVKPGTALETQINYSILGSPCNSIYSKAQYLARNGLIGGDGAVGPTVNFSGLTGYYQAPNSKTLTSQSGFSRFRIFGASDLNTSLPVELTKFFITPVNNEYFNLDWETASEFNNSGFFIERSTNGTPFQQIGWIIGNGTTNTVHEYSFSDRNVLPNTLYYYRLKQVDFNQAFKYSNTLSGILNTNDNLNVFSIVPNPTISTSQATVYVAESGNLQLSVYDVLGQVIKSTSVALNKGNNTVDINLSNLASATYLVKFQFNNNTLTKRIIKN